MKIDKDAKLDIFKSLLKDLKPCDIDCPSQYIPAKYSKLIDYFEDECNSRECDECCNEFFNALQGEEVEEDQKDCSTCLNRLLTSLGDSDIEIG